jgi:hypothetical protein
VAGTPKPAGWSLRWRVASGLVFVPLLILLARAAGGIAFTGFVGLQVTLGLIEFYRMMRGKGLEPDARLGIGAGLGVLWVALHPHGSQGGLLATAFVLLVLALSLRRAPRPHQVESMAVTLFGVLYVGWLSSHFVLLRELPWRAGTDYADGAAYVLLAFFVTWSCDTAPTRSGACSDAAVRGRASRRARRSRARSAACSRRWRARSSRAHGSHRSWSVGSGGTRAPGRRLRPGRGPGGVAAQA